MKSIGLKSLIGISMAGLFAAPAFSEPLEMICIKELRGGKLVTVCYVSEPQLPPIVWA